MDGTTQSLTSRWHGGVSPFGMYWQKMMMWWFIVGDAVLFAGFLASYGFSRLGTANWPDQSKVFDLNLITLMTFVLISSSATMATAVTAARAGDRAKAKKFLGLTVVGGLVFLGMQAYEWSHIIHAGGTLTTNPWGVPSFTAYFFMVTGFHGTHVLIGVIINLITFLHQAKGTGTANGVELAGLYRHFVDLVWVFIFGCFYLI
jgi:cytochrome c oxidase subunit 3